MSLTSFLKCSADVRERFATEFFLPPLESPKKLLVPPLSQNNSLVGTAFDYLLRFRIERLNPKSKTGKWIAEQVVLDYDTPRFHKILAEAKILYSQYLSNGRISDKLLRAVLYLAQLEVLYRSGDDSYYDTVGIIDRKDVRNLRSLISVVPLKTLKAKRVCVLNPTFGRASKLVGGADCDLVIDNALIEIKTVKDFAVRREYFNQLIGYYLLFRIGGISGLPKRYAIKRLGIYFARHGYMWLFDVNTVIKDKRVSGWVEVEGRPLPWRAPAAVKEKQLSDLTRWFRKRLR